jgi:hypothetical protein
VRRWRCRPSAWPGCARGSGVKEYECQARRSRSADGGQLAARRDGFERVCPGDLERFAVGFLPDGHSLTLFEQDRSADGSKRPCK